jgi:dTDP-4-amino-4,6-dideoxygalactose transaminase
VQEQRLAQAAVSVPFLDLTPIHDGLRAQIVDEISKLIDTNAFTNGPHVPAFEEAFARYCGTQFCVGVASGLDALRLSLVAAGIEQGDEVIVPAFTFAATFEAVTQAGGRPVAVDVSEADYNLDADAAAKTITEHTRFVLPVHVYGQMANVQPLEDLSGRYGLRVVEDACQAHGARRDGRRPGTWSTAAAFSFYPAKNLGAMGDAGALATNDRELADRVRALREHGQHAKYEHDMEGYTARLDTVQALVLLHKLPLLDGWNDERRIAAAFYSRALENIGDLRLPPVPAGSEPVWHLYVIRSGQRAELEQFLARRGIATGRHYPQPPHLSRAYGWLGYERGEFPVAEALAEEALSLPIFPGISREQLETVVTAIADFFARG